MLAHPLAVALALILPSATPESPAGASPQTQSRAPQELRNAVHEGLRLEATTQRAEHADAVRQLSALYQELSTTTHLNPMEQRELRALVRSRLVRTSRELQRQHDQVERKAAALGAGNGVPPRAAVLAQVAPNPPGAQPNAVPARPNAQAAFGPGAQTAGAAGAWDAMTAQNAQQLIDLIQATIAPASWDVNGGPGTIMYFAPRQVLVVRQTGGAHEQVGAAIRGLRGN